MTLVNREYLAEQFRLIEEYLRRARGIATRTRNEYLADPYAVDASIRELTVLFETSHNTAKHLIAQYGWKTPANKAEAFEILAEAGVISRELSESLREAARFRNLVVYQTAAVQDDLVYQILQENLPDFEQFVADVARWLRKTSASE
jgi:uncharacterized protein YutE (UPF0331/DUF86 family)